MIKKRLLQIVPGSFKFVLMSVFFQCISLYTNIYLMYQVALLLTTGLDQNKIIIIIICVLIRSLLALLISRINFLSSKQVKKILRNKIYDKLLKIGPSYSSMVNTSEIVQLSVEGVEQLETYFGAYLPQFFYAMLAPISLFIVVSRFDFLTAIILLICVPLIPVTIVIVQRWAKKLLSKYWGQYTALGDTFLENLQGLTTLKIYEADEYKNQKMNEESEKFRKITMKVLTMQLNSITIMDFITYMGLGLGIILSINHYAKGLIDLKQCIWIILLSADFFLPMRTLGSYFHVAMNGMAASDKIFKLLDIEITDNSTQTLSDNLNIEINNLSYSYDDKKVLDDVNISVPQNSFIGITGESGSGKSTLANILVGINKNYEGSILIGDKQLKDIKSASLLKNIVYIGSNSQLFKGTVKENLLIGNPNASDEQLWDVLKKTNLKSFLEEENCLDTFILENSQNISGGQRQRLVLARALLFDSPIYIFDEATSNIDVESEEDILNQIYELAKTKTIIFISHRLNNIINADNIYVLKDGRIIEQGTHSELLLNNAYYKKLYDEQYSLENFKKELV